MYPLGPQEKYVLLHDDSITWVGVTQDGNFIGSTSWDKTAKLSNARMGKLVHVLTGARGRISLLNSHLTQNFLFLLLRMEQFVAIAYSVDKAHT